MDAENHALVLVKPTEQSKDAVLAYRDEFSGPHDAHGTASLHNAASYEQWLQRVRDSEDERTVQKGYVPSSTYLAIRRVDQKLVGILSIRHWLTEALEFEGGHIGYSIRVSERRKGYATEMLRQALSKCAEMKITKALLTCNTDNIGSARVIKANGGVLASEFFDADGKPAQRYWITLTDGAGAS